MTTTQSFPAFDRISSKSPLRRLLTVVAIAGVAAAALAVTNLTAAASDEDLPVLYAPEMTITASAEPALASIDPKCVCR